MSYLQSNLQIGEVVQYKANLHLFLFVQPTILLLLGWWFWLSSNGVCHFFGIILLFLGVVSLIQRLLIKVSSVYAVTNKRVILKTGVISRRALDLILAKCEGIQIKQTILGRLFGFGTLIITTGGATNHYPFVSNSLQFKREINNQIG